MFWIFWSKINQRLPMIINIFPWFSHDLSINPWYPLVMTNSSPWKDPPMLLRTVKASINRLGPWLNHGELWTSVNVITRLGKSTTHLWPLRSRNPWDPPATSPRPCRPPYGFPGAAPRSRGSKGGPGAMEAARRKNHRMPPTKSPYEGFHTWWIPNSWLADTGKSH